MVWIPDKFAKIGKIIKINNNVWEVIKTYSRERIDNLEKVERDYLKQRKASDI